MPSSLPVPADRTPSSGEVDMSEGALQRELHEHALDMIMEDREMVSRLLREHQLLAECIEHGPFACAIHDGDDRPVIRNAAYRALHGNGSRDARRIRTYLLPGGGRARVSGAFEDAPPAESFDLVDMLEDIAAPITGAASRKGVELLVRIDPKLPSRLSGDAQALGRIVAPLLDHAVAATVQGHVLLDLTGETVKEGEGPDRVTLRGIVQDTGPGMAPEDCTSVFDQSAALSTVISGVEAMGGTAGVESIKGEGSTFWFTADLSVDTACSRPAPPRALSGARILIVGESAESRTILAEKLTAWRFDPAACTSGREALAFIGKTAERGIEIDLILLSDRVDDMPLAEVLQRLASLSAVPVILVCESGEDAGDCAPDGVAATLARPVRSAQWLDAISAAVCARRDPS